VNQVNPTPISSEDAAARVVGYIAGDRAFAQGRLGIAIVVSNAPAARYKSLSERIDNEGYPTIANAVIKKV